MDIQPQSQQPISDDQELAKVLAGVNEEAEQAESQQAAELPPMPTPPTPPPTPAPEPVVPASAEPATDGDAPALPPVPPAPAPEPVADTPVVPMPAPAGDSNLDSIKQAALGELRPLVDKLNVSPEEKFDTYLLLLRSTDDKALIAPAHEAAKNIADEARKAQALLDIIKEIDFLSNPQQAK